ncbi:hypothetical protein UAW_01767 [Enterococcus haemoperoxidus ATCC BAA-382]|uniref:Uncharacterized protein n=1 Tax=Enterococcus haemoperoxidus ATCC BAA-382 TaxID=1158608 RepID=R2T985_9ENTE|nr:hypothetical protein [Enterococcus haemoperoxidus]EOH96809.1 hypothetical protein UAW_01767 [Enterococcus haemoperoxidus ATCC BAA-382]EOT60098.1 hypothetical protein I583_02733 [Enterococcus haemoperoxidus ATCC BAA-382]OJG47654.1 hypothetical protein RV06_GL002732 [Enterococcus haemoperoxidus]
MKDYLWIYILGGIASAALLFFLVTLSRDVFLVKKLRKKKLDLVFNCSLLAVSITSLGLIIYLFILLKDQINLIG